MIQSISFLRKIKRRGGFFMNVKRCVLLFCLCLLSGLALAIQIDGFNYADDSAAQSAWVVGGNDSGMGGSAADYAMTTDKVEGTASLKFVYNYSGNAWYEMDMTRTFTTPIDLSQAKGFSLWMYGDTAASANLLWYIDFISSNGEAFCYTETSVGASGWREISFTLNDMTYDPWVGTYYFDNPDMTQISQIRIVVMQTGTVSASGTGTVYFDDLQYYMDEESVGTQVIDSFEYADDAALNAAYAVDGASGFTLDLATTTSLKIDGAKAMQMHFYVTRFWENIYARKTLSEPTDFTKIKYFKVWVYGDPTLAGGDRTPLLLFLLEDNVGNRVWAYIQMAIKANRWSCYFLEFTPGPTDGSTGPFWQDMWDAGYGTDVTDCNITKIVQVGFAFQDNQDHNPVPVDDFTCVVDAITAGYVYTPPPMAAQNYWNIYE